MGKCNRSDYKHIFYNPNRRAKSGEKNQKTIDWCIETLKKKEKGGMDKWVIKTMEKVEARMKRYGITRGVIKTSLDKKGLTNLLPKKSSK